MKLFIGSIFCVVTMVLWEASGSKILGSFGSGGHSHFGGGASQSSYSNNNGIVETYQAFGTYEQLDDGTCIKRLVEIKNGKRSEKIIPMSCEKVKEEIRHQEEHAHKEIEKHQKKMEKEHAKIMKEHSLAADKINKDIKAMHKNFKF